MADTTLEAYMGRMSLSERNEKENRYIRKVFTRFSTARWQPSFDFDQ